MQESPPTKRRCEARLVTVQHNKFALSQKKKSTSWYYGYHRKLLGKTAAASFISKATQMGGQHASRRNSHQHHQNCKAHGIDYSCAPPPPPPLPPMPPPENIMTPDFRASGTEHAVTQTPCILPQQTIMELEINYANGDVVTETNKKRFVIDLPPEDRRIITKDDFAYFAKKLEVPANRVIIRHLLDAMEKQSGSNLQPNKQEQSNRDYGQANERFSYIQTNTSTIQMSTGVKQTPVAGYHKKYMPETSNTGLNSKNESLRNVKPKPSASDFTSNPHVKPITAQISPKKQIKQVAEVKQKAAEVKTSHCAQSQLQSQTKPIFSAEEKPKTRQASKPQTNVRNKLNRFSANEKQANLQSKLAEPDRSRNHTKAVKSKEIQAKINNATTKKVEIAVKAPQKITVNSSKQSKARTQKSKEVNANVTESSEKSTNTQTKQRSKMPEQIGSITSTDTQHKVGSHRNGKIIQVQRPAALVTRETVPKRRRPACCKRGHHRCMYAHKRIQMEIASPVYLKPADKQGKWGPIFTSQNYAHIYELQIFRFYPIKNKPIPLIDHNRPSRGSNNVYLNVECLQRRIYRLHKAFKMSKITLSTSYCTRCETRRKKQVSNAKKSNANTVCAPKIITIKKHSKSVSFKNKGYTKQGDRWKKEYEHYSELPPIDNLMKFDWCLYLANFYTDIKFVSMNTRIGTLTY